MRLAIRLVLLVVAICVAIVFVQDFSAGRFERDYRSQLQDAQDRELLPRTNHRSRALWNRVNRDVTSLAERAGTLPSESAAKRQREVADLGAVANALMAGPFKLEDDAVSAAPDIELAAGYFEQLDALDLGGPDDQSTQLAPVPDWIWSGHAVWLGGVHADRLGAQPDGGALAARRLAQVLALLHHVDESRWSSFEFKLAQEATLLDGLERALVQRHADPIALFDELDPWLAPLARTERYVRALRGEFLLEYDERFLPYTWSGDDSATPDREWRRALCRLACLDDCVRALSLPAHHADQPARDARGELVPPSPPAGDPTHELIDIEFAAQRHRRRLSLARVALALSAHAARTGDFPRDLAGLEDEFGGAPPVDPADGRPFLYKVEPGRATVSCRALGAPPYDLSRHGSWDLRVR